MKEKFISALQTIAYYLLLIASIIWIITVVPPMLLWIFTGEANIFALMLGAERYDGGATMRVKIQCLNLDVIFF